MSIIKAIGSLFGAPGIIDGVIGLVSDYNSNKLTREQLSYELKTLTERQAHAVDLAQISLNKEEAKGNWFQSGWRPATGWVCVTSLAMNYLVSPLLNFSVKLYGVEGVSIPTLDLTVMLPVLLGMLGLGGLRTIEKVKNR